MAGKNPLPRRDWNNKMFIRKSDNLSFLSVHVLACLRRFFLFYRFIPSCSLRNLALSPSYQMVKVKYIALSGRLRGSAFIELT
jgi:hypothetical protein